MGNLGYINDLRIAKLAFNFLNAAFTKTLLLTRRVVFGVFLQVAMLPRFGNRFDDARAFVFFQVFQFHA